MHHSRPFFQLLAKKLRKVHCDIVTERSINNNFYARNEVTGGQKVVERGGVMEVIVFPSTQKKLRNQKLQRDASVKDKKTQGDEVRRDVWQWSRRR